MRWHSAMNGIREDPTIGEGEKWETLVDVGGPFLVNKMGCVDRAVARTEVIDTRPFITKNRATVTSC